jgi:hypothetical protein
MKKYPILRVATVLREPQERLVWSPEMMVVLDAVRDPTDMTMNWIVRSEDD